MQPTAEPASPIRGTESRLIGLLLAVLLVLMTPPAHADQSAGPKTPVTAGSTPAPSPAARAERLIAHAAQLRLAERKEWLRLVHYRKTLFGGWESQVDGPPFFLAVDGKDSPRAELEATLRAFTAPAAAPDVHALCRFPARFIWLANQLSLGSADVPTVACPGYADFVKKLAPRSLTLIFSSYYLNNPASAFGHTFLRVNKTMRSGESESRELLDYGVDFSAVVDTGNAVLYAFKGMFGLFPGTFHKMPFFYKVREYNDFESRDLWEYDLDLSQAQVQTVVAHLWELGQTYIAYYYLSENCSYHILGALEVASPDLELTSKLGWPVIPSDTVKAVLQNRGLVKGISYRPSNRTQFRQRLETLHADEVEAVELLLSDPKAKLDARFSLAKQVRVLDAAIDLVGIRFARDLTKSRLEMNQEGIELEQALLERRAEYDLTSEEPHFPMPMSKVPHGGHDSDRLGLGSGYERERGFFHSLSFRLALHDLNDPARGYPDGAEIDFLPISLRYYIETPRLSFEDFSLIRVVSLTPLSRFDHSMSWLVDAGAKRGFDAGCDRCVSGFGALAGGFTIEPFGRPFTLFALAKVQLDVPVKSGLVDLFRVGVGPYGGVRLRFSDDVSSLFTGSWTYLPGQTPHAIYELHGSLRGQYTRDFALGIEAALFQRSASVQGVSYLYF
jgi:hypothetical protein